MTKLSKIGFPTGNGLAVVALSLTLLLSACDSAEERAEAHFQAGMAHLEQGDVERALIEFRNVFKLNGEHKEARLTYARLERERGNIPAAYSQYLLVIEQYPDNLEGHRALAEMALQLGNWEDLKRYGSIAAELAPEDVEIFALNNTLSYSEGIQNGDANAVGLAIGNAQSLLKEHPELVAARQIVVDHLLRAEEWTNLLAELDTALSYAPEEANLYAIRLRALQELKKTEEIETQLKEMMALFPEDAGVVQMLFEHHLNQKDLDAAEQILRDQKEADISNPLPVQRLVAFLIEHRGADAAIAELDTVIAEGEGNTPRFKTMRAALKFQSGNTDQALAEMQELLEDAPRTTQTRQNEVEYARMLFASGQVDAGRALIDKVLEEDISQADAVKFKAAWLIEEDNIGDAILLLREALSASPRDYQLMSLMAQAHERNGDRALMGEMLALAVEVSQSAPEETLRYSNFLLQGGDYEIAESILVEALNQNPRHPALLVQLGQVYLIMQNWGRLDTILASIQALDDPEASRHANELRAQMLSAQKKTDELASFLNELANDPEFGLSADIALIRLMLTQDDVAGATAQLDELLKEDPDSLILRFVKARALLSDNKLDEAEQVYRGILEDSPTTNRAWLALYLLQSERGRTEQARETLNAALQVVPENPDLLIFQAAEHERAGELDEAIAVYEKLYPLSNRSLVVANNLASLLTTHRSDEESLLKAQQFARRLRGSREPAFQETYGWVAYRLGNYEEALSYLEPAASALSDHPLVLYHLGKAYEAVGQTENALQALKAAQEIDATLDVTPNLTEEIQRLSAAVTAGQ
ncbi:tetratricopeptide repeat protein [Ruegeria sp.]|uniref:tetratricopeptide repeat protein n=1 Tax=Ruegeria sp. TaxID=1879320 RepID=UPI003C7A6CB0